MAEAAPDAGSVAFSSDGRLLAIGYTDGWVRLWNFRTGRKWGEFRKTADTIWEVAFSPDSALLASSAGENVVLYDVARRRVSRTLEAHIRERCTRADPACFHSRKKALAFHSGWHKLAAWAVMLPPETKPHRILVVDDELIIRESIKRMLEFDGNSVETAATGKEALACFEKDKFDLLILDYEMPDMRGDELALLIKALAPNQPIAMVTAYPKTLVGNLLTKVDSIISKPFTPQELREVAIRLLANR